MSTLVDARNEACAVACMLVSDPQSQVRQPGWQKSVNDLIRALRDQRNDLEAERDALVETLTAERERRDAHREAAAQWMVKNGYATGHGDTLADLFGELSSQSKEHVDRMLATEAENATLKQEREGVIAVLNRVTSINENLARENDGLKAERDRLRQQRKRFLGVINDSHDVPPEHESEPVLFHKGWELAVRRVRNALNKIT